MLSEQIKADQIAALKAGDSNKRSVLTMLISAVKNRELAKREPLNDEEVLAVISTEAKRRKEAIDQFTVAGRPELAEQEKSELAILQVYLPEQLNEAATRHEVEVIVNEQKAAGKTEIGPIMAAVMAKLKGKVDGGLVSRIVKELLGS